MAVDQSNFTDLFESMRDERGVPLLAHTERNRQDTAVPPTRRKVVPSCENASHKNPNWLAVLAGSTAFLFGGKHKTSAWENIGHIASAHARSHLESIEWAQIRRCR